MSIDLPGGPFGNGYHIKRSRLYAEFTADRPKARLELIRADSHDTETLRRLKEILQGRLIDFLFIDGDHTYEGVKRDFAMYSSLIRPGGMIGFHDIVNSKKNHEVQQFWNETKAGYRHVEILDEEPQMGIGILYL